MVKVARCPADVGWMNDVRAAFGGLTMVDDIIGGIPLRCRNMDGRRKIENVVRATFEDWRKNVMETFGSLIKEVLQLASDWHSLSECVVVQEIARRALVAVEA